MLHVDHPVELGIQPIMTIPLCLTVKLIWYKGESVRFSFIFC